MRGGRTGKLVAVTVTGGQDGHARGDDLRMSTTSESSGLRRLEDREAIRELIYSYGYYLDAFEFDEYANLFAEDGEWRNHNVTATGPKAIREMVAKMMSGRIPGHGVHVLTSPIIVFEGDDVAKTKVIGRTLFPTRAAIRPERSTGGTKTPLFVSADGTWRFKSRFARHTIPPMD